MYHGNIAIVGAGTMGRVYYKNLLSLGFRPEQFHLIDLESNQFMHEVEVLYPGTVTASGEDPIPFTFRNETDKPLVAFVLVNTSAHIEVIEKLAAEGVKYFFVEKPLCFSPEELDDIEKLRSQGCVFYTAYLFNFSPIVQAMRMHMFQEKLVVLEAHGWHGKNRTADDRPTAGDVQDELTHLAELILSLTEANQTVAHRSMVANVTYWPFTKPGVQESAHQHDPSSPLKPSMSADVLIRVVSERGDRASTTVSLRSSFGMTGQERRLDVVLGTLVGEPKFSYRLDFDLRRSGQVIDRLEMVQLGRDPSSGSAYQPIILELRGDQKIKDEVIAFLKAVVGHVDGRLTGYKQAARMVQFARDVETSAENSLEPIYF